MFSRNLLTKALLKWCAAKVTAAANTNAIQPMATYTVRPSSKKLQANGNTDA